ncbi:MAG: WD40/YVTN/BNR-like repeat-containing protein [Puniceicoccaceae bacterium]
MKVITLLVIVVCVPPLGAKTWIRNTFPGPGHVANAGPWGEGQGSDRTEWVSAFGVSPINANFMLQGTDLGRLVYTNTRLGGTEFIPAEMPLYRVGSVAFHPTDGSTGYALMMEREMPGFGGWWRTKDEGESWDLMYPTVAPSRGQKRLLVVDPSNGNIYIGTTSGLVRSVDNGATWSTIAFSGQSIKCLALSADGTKLYLIPGDQEWKSPRLHRGMIGGNEVWRMDNGNPATLVKVMDLSADPDQWFFDIDVNPSDAGKGVVVVGNSGSPRQRGKLYAFSNAGITRTKLIEGWNMAYARYNPHNASHIVTVCELVLSDPDAFRWSTDGGTSWNSWPDSLDASATTVSSLVDYGPWNFKAPGYEFEKAAPVTGESWYLMMQDRLLLGFPPEPGTENDTTIVMWSTNFGKGPLKSTDYGETFRPFAHGGNFKRAAQISFGSSGERCALAVTEHGFVLTDDGGRTWRAYHRYNTANIKPPEQDPGTRAFELRSAWGLAFDPEDDDTLIGIYGYAPANILRTEDFGATWTVVGEWRPYIPPGTAIYADGNVYWHRQNPGIVYAGNRKSTDGGLSFPTTLTYPVSALSNTNGDHVLSKVSGSNWQLSLDAGANWVQLANPPWASDGQSRATAGGSYTGPAIDPEPPAGKIRILSGGEGGVWEYLAADTAPATGSWTQIASTTFAGDPYLDSVGLPVWTYWVVFDPRPGFEDVVYISTGPPPSNKDRGELLYRQVYRSTDSGVTWTRQTGGDLQGELPDYLYSVAAGISPSGAFTLADYAGLYTLRKTGLDDFLEQTFGPGWVEAGYGGGSTDVDGDGLTESIEYLLDTDPLVPDQDLAAHRLQSSLAGTKLRLTLTNRMGKSGIEPVAEVSSDLLDWDSGSGFVSESISENSPSTSWQEIRFEDLTPVGPGAPRFIRLRVDVQQ